MTDAISKIDPERGLTGAEVASRIESGRANVSLNAPSRTVGQIVKANVFTYFNGLIASLAVLVFVFEPWYDALKDALFGIIAVINIVIGVVQELKAKYMLDSLALTNAPRVRAVRDGDVVEIAVEGVVLDDVLVVSTGDQLVVDGVVLVGEGLSIDESLLTGEVDPIVKQQGDEVLSGSFVVSGSGRFLATRVGDDAYAARLAREAKRFTLVRSELRDGISQVLRIITVVLIPVGLLLLWGQIVRAGLARNQAIVKSIAGVIGMIPEGLVLLTSVAFAASVVRLGRRKTLVQELAAVEGLARVDVVCLDKTGTLTLGGIDLEQVIPVGRLDEVAARQVLGAYVASDDNPNPTQQAVAEACEAPNPMYPIEGVVPFSSARKWSAVRFAGARAGTYVFGAPDVVLPSAAGDDPVMRTTNELAARGRRVLVLAVTEDPLAGDDLPGSLEPVALVSLAEQLRPDAPETLRYFVAQGVTIKVISGDNPRTVAAVAREVGVPGAAEGVDARTLPDDMEELADVLEREAVFGRVQPHQKQAMVRALQSRGHTVAMTGDGVNDTLALKDADIGVAMGSGSSAARAVAQLVLLDNSYASLPLAVAEGRRVIANIERVATLFLTKNVYAAIQALAVTVAGIAFAFQPRHLTLVNALTIGIPGFFLALAPSAERARTGFVRRVLYRSVPAGLVTGMAVFAAYFVTQKGMPEGSTAATGVAVVALLTLGLYVVSLVARPLSHARRILLVGLVGASVAAFAIPFTRRFFALELPSEPGEFAGLAFVAVGVAFLELAWRWAGERIELSGA